MGGEEDIYGFSEPEVPPPPRRLPPKFRPPEPQPMVSQVEPLPPPPRWPMFSGVFTFPWRLQTLGCWMGISFGLIVTGYLFGVLFGPAARVGIMAVRAIFPAACAAQLLALSYAAVCLLKVIEETSYGVDRVDCSVDMGWKEWSYSYAYLLFQIILAATVGYGLKLITFSDSWLPMIIGTFLALPIILLSSLAANAAWLPLSPAPVLRSFGPLWRQWGLFYIYTGGLYVAWELLTLAGLRQSPWLVPLYSGPMMAAAMLIYARLLGRLAWLISRLSEPDG